MSAATRISPDTILEVPPQVAVCPYCETALTVAIEACTQEADGWVATEIQVDCATEPDLETDAEAWHQWMEAHTQLPYGQLLTVHQRVLRWLERHYRFVVDEPPHAGEGGGMSDTYDGLCIAGPLAGQMLSHLTDIYYVALLADPLRVESGLRHHLYTYRWQEWRTDEGITGVWSAPDTDVLRVLLETYAAAHRERTVGEGERG